VRAGLSGREKGLTVTEFAPYSASLPTEDFSEWSFEGDGFQLSLMKVRYRRAGVAAWQGVGATLQYVLASDASMALAWDDSLPVHDFVDLRALTFVGSGRPVHARWRPGRMSRVLCRFDFARLTERMQWASPGPGETPRISKNLSFDSPFIALMMRRLAQEILSPAFGSAFRIDTIVMAIFIDLFRLLDDMDTVLAGSADRLSPQQIRTVHALVTASQAPTIDALGAAFETSGRRLSALYRRSTGMTLRAYIADARIRQGEALLLEPALRIKTIAHRCGFRSTAAFTAAFKRVTAMTPQQFRDAISEPI
jgi:AraC family transcriptional regulator